MARDVKCGRPRCFPGKVLRNYEKQLISKLNFQESMTFNFNFCNLRFYINANKGHFIDRSYRFIWIKH